MINFPEKIMEKLYNLSDSYKRQKTLVKLIYPVVEILTSAKDKEVSTKMFYDYKTGTFEIHPPTYRYFSKISHFDFKKPERRWSRSKVNIFPIIDHLKICGLWELISNRDYLAVNEFNPLSNQNKLNKILEDLF